MKSVIIAAKAIGDLPTKEFNKQLAAFDKQEINIEFCDTKVFTEPACDGSDKMMHIYTMTAYIKILQ